MAYVIITRTPGVTLADYRSVREAMGGGRPDGSLVSIAGEADGALQTVDVWESKAHADRFEAEQLFPVFERLGFKPGPDATYIPFETEEVSLERGVR